MSVDNFIKKVWTKKMTKGLEKSLVFGSVCNRDYEGEIKQEGNTVYIPDVDAISNAAYTKNSTTLTYAALSDSVTTLNIDQARYFTFIIDDVDKAQAGGIVLQKGMQKAVYSLRDTADQFLATKYSSASATVGDSTTLHSITSANILEKVVDLGVALDDTYCSQEGRWMIVPPWFRGKLVMSKALYITEENKALTNGYVGEYEGFTILSSPNCSVATDGTNTGNVIMAGTSDAITFAEQLVDINALQIETKFGDAVRGIHLYGAAVTEPGCLGALYAYQGTEE
jgi:hypothetical protein